MIIVCGLAKAQAQINLHKAKSVIGILGPESKHPDYLGIATQDHLRLTFNDVNEDTPGMISAQASDAERLVKFIKGWTRSAPMVVHCWAGISRSTATAFAAMCILRPNEDEMELAAELRAASPSATPNRLITAKVDHLLGRKGRMSRAVESIGRGEEAFEGTPFQIRF